MTGFGIDPAALEGAIKKLEDIRDDMTSMVQQVSFLKPGELTAQDAATTLARKEIQDRATGENGSLRLVTNQLREKLQEKIDAYRSTLNEYQTAEDAATVDASRVNQQA